MLDPNQSVQLPYMDPEGKNIFTVQDVVGEMDFNGAADLSSRTPVARIWTAVQVIERKYEWHDSKDYKDAVPSMDKWEKDSEGRIRIIYEMRGGKVQFAKKDSGTTVQRSHPKVYMIGNHQNFLEPSPLDSNITEAGFGKIFPREGRSQDTPNEFQRPTSGITNITYSTKIGRAHV